ncbi:MAG: MFS transporter [Bifidobacteriaceae bacterium]|jgi:MFS family permease|nr:MFS transporter [Bifidobacteriaceae bacterium]
MSRSFLAYQGSSLLSDLGNSLTMVVLPVLVLQTTGSVVSAGWVAMATGLPQFLAAIGAGVMLDRVNRRTVAIAGDLASAGSIAGLALIHATVGLNVGWFIVFGCLSAIGDVPAMAARETMAPGVSELARVDVAKTVAVRSGLTSMAVMAGPALAGAMIGWGIGGAALWITATTSAVAAGLGLLIPRVAGQIAPSRLADAERRRAAKVNPLALIWREFLDGLRHLGFELPLVRLASLISVVLVCATAVIQGLAVPFLLISAGQPSRTGITVSVLALGTGLGAGIYGLGHRHLRPRLFGIIGSVGAVAGAWTLASLPPFWLLLVGSGVLGVGGGLLGALFGTLSVTSPDPAMRGRVLGNQTGLVLGIAPFAVLGAGFAIDGLGLGETLGLLAALVTICLIFTVLSRSWRFAPPPAGLQGGVDAATPLPAEAALAADAAGPAGDSAPQTANQRPVGL